MVSLDLSWCPRITDAALEYIACDLTHLEELTLDRSDNLLAIILYFVLNKLRNFLSVLGMDLIQPSCCRCVHISDIGVGYISTMLALGSLFLRWCSQIRDFGLQHICGMRNLRILSVAGEHSAVFFLQ